MKAILTFILLLSVCSVFGQSTVPTPLAGGTAMAVNRTYKDQFTGDRTMTFTGNASEGVTITLLMDVTTGVTITFPSSYQEGGAVTPITSLVFAAGQHFMQWRRVGSNWTLWDSTSASNAAVSDTAVAASWNGVTLIAPSKNAVHDWGIIFDTDLDGKVNVLDVGAGLTKTDSSGVVSAASAGTDYYAPGSTDVAVADGGTGASTLSANAVLLGNGTSALQTVAPGTSGNVLTSNGTTWTSAAPSAGSSLDFDTVRQNLFVQEEFFGTAAPSTPYGVFGLNRTVANSASSSVGPLGATDAAPGVMVCQTGTNSAGAMGFITQNSILFGNGTYAMEARVQLDVAADGTNSYSARIGFLDSASAEPTDGAYFRYDQADASWITVCRSNNTETASAVDSTVDLSAATWTVLRVEVNAAASSVVFKINGTTVRTETANIPSGASRHTGLGFSIIKSAGTTSRSLSVDFLNLKIGLTASR